MFIEKLVLIHIDALRREYSYCYLLSEMFKKLGYKVLLVSRRNIYRYTQIFQPQILILSHSTTLPYKKLSLMSEKTDIYIVPVEVMGTPEKIYELDYEDGKDYNIFSGLFLWNSQYKEWMINKRQIQPEKVYAIGSPRIGLNDFIDKKETTTIGFISRFEFINPFNKKSTLEVIFNLEERYEFLLGRWFAEIEGFNIYKKAIDFLINNGHRVSIRPHPNETVETYNILKKKYGDMIIIDTECDYHDWLSSVNLVVATVSTSLTEPYLLKKPIICIDDIMSKRHILDFEETLIHFYKIGYMPKSMEELKDLLSKDDLVAKQDEEVDEFLDLHYDITKIENNTLCEITEEVHRKATNYKLVQWKYIFSKVSFIILDNLLLLKQILKGQLYLEKQYHFSSLLHKPSKFMMNAKEKLLKK